MDKDFLDSCPKTGITLSFWAKQPYKANGARYVEIHSPSKNGFRVIRSTSKIDFVFMTDTLYFQCTHTDETLYEESDKWSHYAISFRIQPSPKMTCYYNGNRIGGQELSRSVEGKKNKIIIKS